MQLLLAACAFQQHSSSCSITRCHVSLHSSSSRTSAGAIFTHASYLSVCVCVRACTRKHRDTNGASHGPARAYVHTLCTLLQKSHVLQGPWRGGGETYDKLWHFYFSYKRYNCPQSVKMRCTSAGDQKARFITEITSKIHKERNNANPFVLGGTRLLYAKNKQLEWIQDFEAKNKLCDVLPL